MKTTSRDDTNAVPSKALDPEILEYGGRQERQGRHSPTSISALAESVVVVGSLVAGQHSGTGSGLNSDRSGSCPVC